MALHPHVVRKAQDELDRVVGSERLPELSDWENLPYISALLKELLRWTCPTPLGISKRVMEDDTYGVEAITSPPVPSLLETLGKYYLGDEKSGSSTYSSSRSVCYDETTFPAPYTYDPERFLKDGKLDGSIGNPEECVFGSGRRCVLGTATRQWQFAEPGARSKDLSR